MLQAMHLVSHALGQVHCSGRTRPPQIPTAVPSLLAAQANQVSNLDITYLPNALQGICLYLYLLLDV
jgi:hypothetical protein